MPLRTWKALSLFGGVLLSFTQAGSKFRSPVSSECEKKNSFQCKSGPCLPQSFQCDGEKDCNDGSDEDMEMCATFLSSKEPNQCLTATAEGKSKCLDVDECKKFGTCSQICNNFVGSFECSCMSGFRLSNDNSSCELTAMRMDLEGEHYYFIVENQGAPVSVAYDARNYWVYWTDVDYHKEAIWKSKLNGTKKEKIVTSGLSLPEGIAFDWIGNNIYFTDSGHRHIIVCTADGVNCTVLIKEQMDKPRDLAVHPNLGLLFWTDWGISPSIIRAGMDGSTPLAIVSGDLKWPNGIAIDQGNSRVYWTDAGTNRIESANFDGSDRQVIHTVGIKHPFDVEVLGDDIYWSDWNLYEIQQSNKFDGSHHKILIKEQHEQLNGIALVHKANQPIGRRNHCKDSGCSHICVLTQNSYRCLCPEVMVLDEMTKRDCLDVTTPLPGLHVTSEDNLNATQDVDATLSLPKNGIDSNASHHLALNAFRITVLLLVLGTVTGVFLYRKKRKNIHRKMPEAFEEL